MKRYALRSKINGLYAHYSSSRRVISWLSHNYATLFDTANDAMDACFDVDNRNRPHDEWIDIKDASSEVVELDLTDAIRNCVVIDPETVD